MSTKIENNTPTRKLYQNFASNKNRNKNSEVRKVFGKTEKDFNKHENDSSKIERSIEDIYDKIDEKYLETNNTKMRNKQNNSFEDTEDQLCEEITMENTNEFNSTNLTNEKIHKENKQHKINFPQCEKFEDNCTLRNEKVVKLQDSKKQNIEKKEHGQGKKVVKVRIIVPKGTLKSKEEIFEIFKEQLIKDEKISTSVHIENKLPIREPNSKNKKESKSNLVSDFIKYI